MRHLNALRCAITCGAALVLWSCDRAANDAPPSPVAAMVQSMAATLVGQPGPAITFETLDGQIVDLRQSYGRKPVYLKMWATWCGPCRAQMPHLESTYARLKDDFTVLAVATGMNETEDEVRAFVEQTGLLTPIAIDDGRFAAAIDLRVTPVHVVIGRDGRVLYVGQQADQPLEAALTAAALQTSPAGLVEGRAPDAPPALARLPERNVQTIDGDEIELVPAGQSEPTVMLFFLPWCESYFAESKPELARRCGEVRDEAARLQAEGGARWIGVSSRLWAPDDAETRGYRDANAVAFPLVFDETGELFESFGVRSTPTIVVANADGEIVARIDAAGGEAELRAALNRAR